MGDADWGCSCGMAMSEREWPNDARGFAEPTYLDDRFNYGRLSFARNSTPVWAPAALLHAGESLEVISDEFELTPAEADDVARYVERHAHT